uniref:Uncharacterized protein n=1 Tax=Anguilla anguilla TaxID=7936 RepID=A0A0E9QU21_ANGAN
MFIRFKFNYISMLGVLDDTVFLISSQYLAKVYMPFQMNKCIQA